MIDWDEVRFFLAVARRGSITAAARDLGVNHSTVSRRIAAFEDNLGVRLFDRVASGYSLTQAGQEMLPSAQRMEEEALSLDRKLFGRDTELNGTLRVTTGGPFVNPFFMDQIHRFLEDYPGIELELIVTNDVANLHAREVDVALRATDNPPETLVGRRIGRMVARLYGRKEFLAPNEPGAPNTADRPSVVGYTNPTHDIMDAGWFRDVYPNAQTRLRVNSPEAMFEAIRGGVGIGMLPCFVGDSAEDLRRLPPFHAHDVLDLWLLTHADLRKTAKVRAFMNFMADAIMPHKDLIEGRRPPNFSSGGAVKMSSTYMDTYMEMKAAKDRAESAQAEQTAPARKSSAA